MMLLGHVDLKSPRSWTAIFYNDCAARQSEAV